MDRATFASSPLKRKEGRILHRSLFAFSALGEEKNKSITDSIQYAKRIQQSLLPTEKYIEKSLKRLKKIK
jgi:hypothetical protein